MKFLIFRYSQKLTLYLNLRGGSLDTADMGGEISLVWLSPFFPAGAAKSPENQSSKNGAAHGECAKKSAVGTLNVYLNISLINYIYHHTFSLLF